MEHREFVEHEFEVGDRVVIAVHAINYSRYRNAVWSPELCGERLVWTVEERFCIPLHGMGTSTFEYNLVDESCDGHAYSVSGIDLEALPIELGLRRIRCRKK